MSAFQPTASDIPRTRPQTHKPRGVCRYYTAPRGCFAGDHCKFLHGEPSSVGAEQGEEREGSASSQPNPPLTPYDQAKRCRFYAQGFCKRGESCWFRHVLDTASLSHQDTTESGAAPEDSDSGSDTVCSICYEKPATYGLLSGCSHVFCISCIREWRDRKSKSIDLVNSSNNKKCPMCRESSHFITPSSMYLKHGTPEKELVIAKYKESMARVQCRYFERTKNDPEPMCPFGKDCFYKHEKADGTTHVFREGASASLRRFNTRGRPPANNFFVFTDSFTDRDTDEARIFGLPFNLDMPFLDLFNPRRAADRRGGGYGAPMNQPPNPDAMQQQGDPPARRLTMADTLRDVERALDALDETVNPGSTDRLSTTLQGLQSHLGQEVDPAIEDGEPVEHLHALATRWQMRSSMDILEAESGTHTRRRHNPFITFRTQLLQLERRDPPVHEAASDEEMPDLQSISNSSEEDYASDTSDDLDSDSDGEGGSGLEFYLPTTEQDRLLSRLGRRTAEHTATPPTPRADEPPPLLPIASLSSDGSRNSSPIPVPPPPDNTSSGVTDVTESTSTPPPFVTDGRGRVVWTSADSRESHGPTTNTAVPSHPSPLSSTEPDMPVLIPSSPSTSSRLRTPGSPRSSRKCTTDAPATGPGEFSTDGRGRVVAVSSDNVHHVNEE